MIRQNTDTEMQNTSPHKFTPSYGMIWLSLHGSAMQYVGLGSTGADASDPAPVKALSSRRGARSTRSIYGLTSGTSDEESNAARRPHPLKEDDVRTVIAFAAVSAEEDLPVPAAPSNVA
ncbi:MAG TPA: hypothetical protein VJS66_01135 [Burkholderiales bacterium]|nr:hypothetical protein [Burkholderiales bacterium]